MKGVGVKKTELFFPFKPVPKGRPRFTRKGFAYTPDKTRKYEKDIAEFYSEHCNDFYDGAIKVNLIFNMPIPKSITKKIRNAIITGEIKYIKKPDADNLCKAFTDALNGIAFADDSLITKLCMEKRYSDSEVGTFLMITEDVD